MSNRGTVPRANDGVALQSPGDQLPAVVRAACRPLPKTARKPGTKPTVRSPAWTMVLPGSARSETLHTRTNPPRLRLAFGLSRRFILHLCHAISPSDTAELSRRPSRCHDDIVAFSVTEISRPHGSDYRCGMPRGPCFTKVLHGCRHAATGLVSREIARFSVRPDHRRKRQSILASGHRSL